jgi:primosomal protein N'
MDEGVRGKYKEHVLLGKIAASLGQQTRVILVVPESP